MRPGFDSWVGKIPCRRERLPTPVFLPGEFHGQRSLAGCSPWGRKESDTTEQLSLFFSLRDKLIFKIPATPNILESLAIVGYPLALYLSFQFPLLRLTAPCSAPDSTKHSIISTIRLQSKGSSQVFGSRSPK